MVNRNGQTPANLPSDAAVTLAVEAGRNEGLDRLNAALFALAAIFPDVQHEVLREMLDVFPEESRMQVIIETLLRNKEKWVKGRWRVTAMSSGPADSDFVALQRRHRFRTQQYKDAVKAVMYQEFKALSHSTIKGVMAENNYFYLEVRRLLLDLAAKSWRQSFTNLWNRSRGPSDRHCPLIKWRSVNGVREPVLVPTSSKELDDEIENLVIKPLRIDSHKRLTNEDQALAERINEQEANSYEAAYECVVCFSYNSFERTAMCVANCHSVCYDCVRRTVSEALFGQGWAKSIDQSRWTLACVSTDDCDSYIQRHNLRQALHSSQEGQQLWDKLQQRAAKDELAHCKEPTISCSSCTYSEVDTMANLDHSTVSYSLFLGLLFLARLLWLLFEPLLTATLSLLHNHDLRHRNRRCAHIDLLDHAWRRYTNPRNPFRSNDHALVHPFSVTSPQGRKFICRNPSCARTTCLYCNAPWHDPHACRTAASHSQTLSEARQHFISARVTEAIKRVCPRCHTAFVKASGCNKITCPCGHVLCNLCRANLTSGEGYSHFCTHFRSSPGQKCGECDKCELYREEAEDEVIKRARETAVEEWEVRLTEEGQPGVVEEIPDGQHIEEEVVRTKNEGASRKANGKGSIRFKLGLSGF